MSCIPPTTRSPGHIVWYYLVDGNKHSFSMRLIDSVDIALVTPLVLEAIRIATAWKPAFTAAFNINEMAIKNASGAVVYAQSIGPFVGTASAPIGSQAWRSTTVTFTGRGEQRTPGGCTGPARTVFETRDSVTFIPTEKYFDTNAVAGWSDLLDAFNTSLYGPADFFGQQAGYNSSAPVQFNARLQRKYGC